MNKEQKYLITANYNQFVDFCYSFGLTPTKCIYIDSVNKLRVLGNINVFYVGDCWDNNVFCDMGPRELENYFPNIKFYTFSFAYNREYQQFQESVI